MVFLKDASRLIVTESNRWYYPNATSGLSVVNVSTALVGQKGAVLGRIPTGQFPKEFALNHDQTTLLVTDHDSQ